MQSSSSAVSPRKPKLDSTPTTISRLRLAKYRSASADPARTSQAEGRLHDARNTDLAPEAEAESPPLAVMSPGPHHNPRLTHPHPASRIPPWMLDPEP